MLLARSYFIVNASIYKAKFPHLLPADCCIFCDSLQKIVRFDLCDYLACVRQSFICLYCNQKYMQFVNGNAMRNVIL